jgi:hypothetical protein
LLEIEIREEPSETLRLACGACSNSGLDDVGNVNSALNGGRGLGRNGVVASGRDSDSVDLDGCNGALNGDSSGHNGRSSQSSGRTGGGDTIISLGCKLASNIWESLHLADRAGSDGGLDDISNVNSALSGGGEGNGARLSTSLSISHGGAAVVVRARNTSGQGTRCGTSGQGSSGHASGVGGRNDADSGLQAGGDAGDLEVVLVLAKHVEVVAGSLVSGGAGQTGVKSSGA